MRTILLGATGRSTLVVAPEHLANHLKNPSLPPVLATPIMVLVMENAALNAIRDILEPDESAVGAAIDVHHLASTPVGQQVTAEAKVTSVEGRRIVFAVRAWDEFENIGTGVHERVVVHLDHVAERLKAKRSRKPRR